jgi:hypothetical protein
MAKKTPASLNPAIVVSIPLKIARGAFRLKAFLLIAA